MSVSLCTFFPFSRCRSRARLVFLDFLLFIAWTWSILEVDVTVLTASRLIK